MKINQKYAKTLIFQKTSFSACFVGRSEDSRSVMGKTRHFCKIANLSLVDPHTRVGHVCSTWIVGATTSKAHIISGSCPGHTPWEHSTSNTWIYFNNFYRISSVFDYG